MALTKSAVAVQASTTSTAGSSTKASPAVTGSAIDCRTYHGGELTYKITNGSSAPGVAASILFQVSHDGTAWYDYAGGTGTTVASDVSSGAVPLDRGVMYVRFLAYGNTTNNVTVEANLQAVTAV